jgi:hypothetical protein
MNKTIEKIKQKWNENPLEVIMVGSVVATTVVALMNGLANAQSRRAYAKQINMKYRNQ